MRQFFMTLIGIVVIVLIALTTWTILRAGWNAYWSLSENVQVAIAAGLITLITTLGSLVYTKIKEKKLQIEAANNQHKQKLYTEFTDKIINLMADPSMGDNEELMQEMRLNFMKNAFLWSDPDVLKAYRNFRTNTQTDDTAERALYDVFNLLINFRKDLGLSNKGVSPHLIADILFDQATLVEFYEKFPDK